MADRKEMLPDEYKKLETPVAAAQRNMAPAQMGLNVKAPDVATEDKATFTEQFVSKKQ